MLGFEIGLQKVQKTYWFIWNLEVKYEVKFGRIRAVVTHDKKYRFIACDILTFFSQGFLLLANQDKILKRNVIYENASVNTMWQLGI